MKAQITRIDEDYVQSGEVPPKPPEWLENAQKFIQVKLKFVVGSREQLALNGFQSLIAHAFFHHIVCQNPRLQNPLKKKDGYSSRQAMMLFRKLAYYETLLVTWNF